MSSDSDSDIVGGLESSAPCYYCGKEDCFGDCDDPDVCRSCWVYENVPSDFTESYYDDDGYPVDQCMENDCTCKCHAEIYEDLRVRFEAGVRYDEDEDPPFTREGVFPFMKLPGEIREKIYSYAFLQEGKQRKRPSAKHRGSIHTNLLRTCKQVYREAGTLPLTLNKLSFNSALNAFDFVACLLVPALRHLVTAVHIEYHFHELGDPAFKPLARELAKLSITHLSLTVKGGVVKEMLIGHTCWINTYKELKQLKTFDLTLASGLIKEEQKTQIQEICRKELINGYVSPEEGKSTVTRSKRPASNDSSLQLGRPTKKAKNVFPTKHQANIVNSSKSQRLGFKSTKVEREAVEETARLAAEQARESLLSQYALIKDYATSVESDAVSVKIRLEEARKAAEAIDERNFQLLIQDILMTLNDRFEKITAARTRLPCFSALSTALKPFSSQESTTSFDTQTSFDNLMEL